MGENTHTRFEFTRLIEDGVVQVLQPDLSKAGRITEALRIGLEVDEESLVKHPVIDGPGYV